MPRHSNILTLLLGLTSFVAYGQKVMSKPADKFLVFLNNYQVDSLQTLVTEDFHIKRTYTTYINDKKSFLNEYIPASKNFNEKYKILKTTESEGTREFWVADQSDYFKYLGIDYPERKIILSITKQDKIACMTIDTIKGYQTYLSQLKQKDRDFESWLKTNYPAETKKTLYITTGLLISRLKEYAEKYKR